MLIVFLDFVKISVDLAHEYVKLGKRQKAVNIYKHTLSTVKDVDIALETRVLYLLRYTESLASTGNMLKRYGGLDSLRTILIFSTARLCIARLLHCHMIYQSQRKECLLHNVLPYDAPL